MWTRMMCFVLFFVLVEINAGTVKITDLGAIFEAGDYKVRISKNICWTIREITFKNTKLMHDCPGAYNGSVLKTRLKESGKVDWVGTGHGHEVVESVKLLIDGKVQPIKNGTVYSGNKFCFIKNSDLRVLKLNATMIIADSGIIEKHKYTVVRNSPDISLLYIFMHSFDVNMKEWLVKKRMAP